MLAAAYDLKVFFTVVARPRDRLARGHIYPADQAEKLLEEGHAGNDAEIAEWMSGNICRCAAYPNIRATIRGVRDAAGGER